MYIWGDLFGCRRTLTSKCRQTAFKINLDIRAGILITASRDSAQLSEVAHGVGGDNSLTVETEMCFWNKQVVTQTQPETLLNHPFPLLTLEYDWYALRIGLMLSQDGHLLCL